MADSRYNPDLTQIEDLDWIQWDLDPELPPTTPAEGLMYWNSEDGTLNLGMPGGDVNLQLGQELIVRVVNDNGSTITNGSVVYVSGATGSNVEVKKPIATDPSTAPRTFAVATEDIEVGQRGYVTLIGNVRDMDTSGGAESWVDGDIVYLSDTVAGGLTKNRPVAPDIAVVIGVILRAHASTGVLAVNPTVVQRISLSSDVFVSGIADNHFLQWDTADSRWENTGNPVVTGTMTFDPTELSITAAGGITPTRSIHGITGNGGAVEITANPQIAAGVDGQLLILEGRSDTNTVTLNTGNGVHLHGKATIGNHDVLTLRYDGVNSEWTEAARNFNESEKAWSFASPSGAAGTFYTGGYYIFNSGNSTFVAPQTLGTANVSYAAHAFIVAGASPSSDSIITVTGTSINDDGVRTPGDSQAISVLSTASANDYFETPKKWIGQMTFTFTSGDNTVNYNWGMCKYWDNNNNDFRISGIEVTGRAGANDSAPNISLIHHKPTGWTYNAGSTPTPPAAVANMNTDHVTEIQYANAQNFAWKRSNLAETVLGGTDEGTIIQWDTTANRAVDIAHVLLRIRGN